MRRLLTAAALAALAGCGDTSDRDAVESVLRGALHDGHYACRHATARMLEAWAAHDVAQCDETVGAARPTTLSHVHVTVRGARAVVIFDESASLSAGGARATLVKRHGRWLIDSLRGDLGG